MLHRVYPEWQWSGSSVHPSSRHATIEPRRTLTFRHALIRVLVHVGIYLEKGFIVNEQRHVECTVLHSLSWLCADQIYICTNLFRYLLMYSQLKTVLLHNVAAHNVNVTGRVCYLT
jgi:hypothetical protein